MNKEEMSILNTNDWYAGIRIIEKYWNEAYGTLRIEGNKEKQTLELITGGWSDNEEIIDILANKAFWFLWWQESKRGGYYKFIYTETIAKEDKNDN